MVVMHEGDSWRVVSMGAMRNGKTFCHLVSQTRRNGDVPVQINDWLELVPCGYPLYTKWDHEARPCIRARGHDGQHQANRKDTR